MVQANINSPSGICRATEVSISEVYRNTSLAFCLFDVPHRLVNFKVVVLWELRC